MHQASDELRNLMKKRFGDYSDDQGPIKYLKDAGYKLTKKWQWEPKPGVTNPAQMTQEEFECMAFLVHEWDFGGLIEAIKGN